MKHYLDVLSRSDIMKHHLAATRAEPTFTHKHFVRCVSIGVGEVAYRPSAQVMSLQTYINGTLGRLKKITAVMKYQFRLFIGVFFHCIPNEFRLIFRGMVHFLVDLHQAGYRAGDFGMENLVYDEETVKFISLTFQELNIWADKNILDQKKEDYTQLHLLILEILGMQPNNKKMPDMYDFFQQLENPTGENEDILKHHLAVLSRSERFSFVRESNTFLQ